MTVIDTSTLISLAKIGNLELLPRLRRNIVLPEVVFEEAVTGGEEKGIADAMVIKGFIETSGLKILRSKIRSDEDLRKQIKGNLAKGDEAVLSLPLSEKASEIITNDDGLCKIAMGLGIRVVSSPDLLMEALRKGVMDLQDFEISLRGLVVENRLSAAVAEFYLMEGKKDVKG